MQAALRQPWTARLVVAATVALALALATPAQAQPFGAWMTLAGSPQHGYIEVPSAAELNPTDGFTLEAWVNVTDAGGGCSSIVGKGWQATWWVGLCDTTLRSYLKGSPSLFDAGTIPPGRWTHIAVSWDGATRRHYVDGELAGEAVLAGPLPTNDSPLRIGSDVSWQFTPAGAIDEVRLWSVGRSEAQLRAAINRSISSPEPGLIAVWSLDASPLDAVGGHDGAVGGVGIGATTFPVAIGCVGSDQVLCVRDRFAIRAEWRDHEENTGVADVVPFQTEESGLFTFFSPTNWEIQVKVLDGCGLNSRYWVFSAATTNVFYRMEVFDVLAGVNKVYFNYPGPPAPAVTDVDAFATCP